MTSQHYAGYRQMKKFINSAVITVASLISMGMSNAHAATIDFNGFANGAHVTSVNFGFGSATVTATGGLDEAWAYDTTNNSNGDPDLFGPFSTVGGGITGYNAGNVLIIQENNGSNRTPDDNAGGGRINFVFNAPVVLNSIDAMDMDSSMVTVLMYDATDTQIGSSWTNVTDADTNNSTFPNLFETIQFGTGVAGVKRMELILDGSGGIDNINVSAVPLPAAAPLFASALGLFGFLQSRRRSKYRKYIQGMAVVDQ